MSKQEKIVCAAVRTNEHGTKIRLYVEYPDHIKQDKQIYGVFGECSHERGFITNKNRFVDPKEAMKIAVKADQVGGILWKKVEARMLNDCGFIDRSKVKRKAIDETIKNYLEFPLMPEDLY